MTRRKLILLECLFADNLRFFRDALLLAILFALLLAAQGSMVSAQGHCGFFDRATRRFVCKNVPEYFIDNLHAIDRTIAEVTRRMERTRTTGAPFVMPALVDHGYRCPDSGGNCPNVWIPSPGGTSGLSGPTSFGGWIGGRYSNTANFQRISAAGIGDQSIIDLRPIDAVDIWGKGHISGEVCFVGEGRILYVETRYLPRTKRYLSTTMTGEKTCATVPDIGQVIFLPPSD